MPQVVDYYAGAAAFLAFYYLLSTFTQATKVAKQLSGLAVKIVRIVITILGIITFIAIITLAGSVRFRAASGAVWNHQSSFDIKVPFYKPLVLVIPNITPPGTENLVQPPVIIFKAPLSRLHRIHRPFT
ncbi:hypothetical protein RUND412_001978 [Rhizina undulata]